jgi:putative methanogenesis marker protein 3
MIEVHLDGTRMEIQEGMTLGDLLPHRGPECSVAVIRPSEAEEAETKNIKFYTTAGELVVEIADAAVPLLKKGVFDIFFTSEKGAECFNLGWNDRYTAAFGPCESDIVPAKASHRYSKGDVILGCGGYDPRRSYLIFAKVSHHADHGSAVDGGVIGRVVSGRIVIERWSPGDVILNVERVTSWADQSISFLTTDDGLLLEDGMHIISFVKAVAEGYSADSIDTSVAESVEHFLLTFFGGYFRAGRTSSTHIRDEKMMKTDVPQQAKKSRLEGTVTVRTQGKSRGCIYIYTQDTASSPYHTSVGIVEHGIELVRLAKRQDAFCIEVVPERFDLLGLSVEEAQHMADKRGITLLVDSDEGTRIVVGQEPATTLEILAIGETRLTTNPVSEVIDIILDDKAAPKTCAIFRGITGLNKHKVGAMPLFFHYEDVYLFKPMIRIGTNINLENIPQDKVLANTLAMTNDARKGAGLVGIRTSENSEFGPTSEPLGATNVMGHILDPGKLEKAKEGEMVYVREVTS